MKTSIIRQGDVLLVPVRRLPAGLKPVAPENGRVVLAHGEATGHHHSFAFSDRAALFREDGGGGGLFLSIAAGAPAALEHQEHAAFWRPDGTRFGTTTEAERAELAEALADGTARQSGEPTEPGLYRVVRQREYSPEASRQVAD